MLQLDANLIEGEPYICLAQKNKRRQNVVRQNSNILEMWETGFKTPPRRTASVWGPVRYHRQTDFLATTHPPVGQKRHSLPLNTKLLLQLTTVYGWYWNRIYIIQYISRQRNMSARQKTLKQLQIRLDLY